MSKNTNISLDEMLQKAAFEELRIRYPHLDKIDEDTLKKDQKNIQLLSEMMSNTGKYRGPKISMGEALRAPDVSILFPKVISDILLRPREPLMIGSTLLSKTVQVDGTRSVEFPVLGALRAFDLPETGEYREQLAPWTEHLTEIKVLKSGLLVAVSEEVIEDSMWDVLALYIEAAGYAMLRHKEEKIFNEFQQKLHAVYDNAGSNPDGWTHGRDESQNRNYSVTFDDMLDTMGGLVAQEYVPTDMVMHPLTWTILAKDPIIRNVFFTQGQIGQTIWRDKPDFDQQMHVPWNIKYQVTPFVPFQYNATLATGPASGLSASMISDIYFIDRQNTCVVLQRTPMSMEQFDDPMRDIVKAKMCERYGVGVVNEGRAGAVIKNVRIVQNWAPIQTVYQVTPP